MCGRFGLFAELDALAEQFNFDPSIMQDIYSPRWNIPPTVPVLTVQPSSSEGQSGRNTARLLRWGMTGARNPRAKSSRPLFNARAETVHKLPSFRQPFRERRCLIPASGFYEWRKDDSGNRTPVWFHRKDDAPVAFAGIWSAERGDGGDIEACAVITCAANELAAPVHQRMPVILPTDAYDDWLNPDTDAPTLLSLIQPVEWPGMSRHTVSTEVNRPSGADRASGQGDAVRPDRWLSFLKELRQPDCTMVKRIQRNEGKGIRHPANTLYCGWPTERGNSFPIGEKYTREEALEVFRRAFWANELPMTPERARAELADYDFLPCLCRLDQPSHVDEYTRDIRCEHRSRQPTLACFPADLVSVCRCHRSSLLL